jgi:integrase/recombinase XerD
MNERILEISEVTKLFTVIASVRDKALIAVLYYGGLRVSEAVNLKWGDLKADRLTILGKGNKIRIISLHPLALSLINQLGDNQSEYIFIGNCNRNRLGAITAKTAHTLIKKYARLAGLGDNLSCHWLRHSIATHLFDNGVDIVEIRDFLGHDNISGTEIYIHSKKITGSDVTMLMPMVMLG